MRILICLVFLLISFAASGNYKGFGKDSVDPQTLKQFAPTSLEPELSRKIQMMLDLRAPGMGMLSPDKKTLFFTWRVTGSSQVWKVNGPLGFPIQMTGGEDATFINDITLDGKFLILSRDRNGEEHPGLYLQSTQGGELKKIIHEEKLQVGFEFVTKDSQWIYYRANRIQPDSYAIYKYNLETAQTVEVFTEPGLWSVLDHNEQGELILAKAVSNLASEVYLFNESKKKLTPLIGQNEKEEYVVAFGPRKNEYFVLTPKGGEFRVLYKFKNQKLAPITKGLEWDVDSFSIDRSRKTLFYTVNEGGYSKTYARSAKDLSPIKLPKFKKADHVVVGAISQKGDEVMLGVVTSQNPRVSYSYNLKTQKLTQWLIPSTPEVDSTKFAVAQLEFYEARDGKKIPMFVRRPAKCLEKTSNNPCPVVVHFHGGPEGQSVSGFNLAAQLFVEAGFIFVEPNVRGSDGYGKSWIDADNGPKRLEVISDIEDTSVFIKKNWRQGDMIPKVGIMGWSYGGYSALMGMTRFSGSFDAGVALVGMSDLRNFLLNTAPYRRALRTPEYGDPEKDKEALKQLSPVTYMDQLKAPLLIIQGVSDPRVPVGEALNFHKTAQKKGVKSQLILFADEGHGASKRSNQVLELGHTLGFFNEHLK